MSSLVSSSAAENTGIFNFSLKHLMQLRNWKWLLFNGYFFFKACLNSRAVLSFQQHRWAAGSAGAGPVAGAGMSACPVQSSSAKLLTGFFGTAWKAGESNQPGMLSNRLSLINFLLLKAVDYCAGKGSFAIPNKSWRLTIPSAYIKENWLFSPACPKQAAFLVWQLSSECAGM